MKEPKAQQGSEMGEKKSEKIGGLEFMGMRFNIIDRRHELLVNKEITSSENFLLEKIELGTIGARNARSTICSKAEFNLDDLSRGLGYKEKDKIWKLLKSLHKKNLIIRESTRYRGLEVLGLNPVEFGQILIDSQHAVEKKKHLKLAVDNSQNTVDIVEEEPTNHTSITDKSSVNHHQNVGSEQINCRQTDSQPQVIIDEKPLLDSSRLILESFRGRKRFNLSQGEMGSEDIERRRQFLLDQAKMLAAQEGVR